MANLTVSYPPTKTVKKINALDSAFAGDIVEWENDFWIVTNVGGVVSLTRGEWTDIRAFDINEGEDIGVKFLQHAKLYPYGDGKK